MEVTIHKQDDGKVEIAEVVWSPPGGQAGVIDTLENGGDVFLSAVYEAVTGKPRKSSRVDITALEEKTSVSAFAVQEWYWEATKGKDVPVDQRAAYDKLIRDLERYFFLMQLERGVPRFTVSEWKTLLSITSLQDIEAYRIDGLPNTLGQYIEKSPGAEIDIYTQEALRRKLATMTTPALFVLIETLDHLWTSCDDIYEYLVNYDLVASEYYSE